MRTKFIVFGLLAIVLMGALGPARQARVQAAPAAAPAAAVAQSPAELLDTAHFLADMGLAFYAFYHYVWQRYQNNQFSVGTPGRFTNMAKAAIALAFSVHEMQNAYKIASKSHDKALKLLVAPLGKLVNHVDTEEANLKKGHYNNNDVKSLNNDYSNFNNYAQYGAGLHINQIPVNIPSAV